MSDYISREAALQALCKAVHKKDGCEPPCRNQIVSCLWSKTKTSEYAEEILKVPAADVVPVGRCRDRVSGHYDEENKLKPCPFCGGKAYIRQKGIRFFGQNFKGWKKERRGFYVQCGRCKARGGVFTATVIRSPNLEDTDKEMLQEGATRLWNTRR